MAKPTGTDTNVTWGESAYASVLEPSGAKQGILFQGDERPAAQYFNWFLRTLSRWIRYLNDFESLGHYWDALQIFRGSAGDDNSALTVQPASITTRKLVFEMGGGAAGRKVRFYRVGATGVWEVTFNAAWRASDSKWVADVSIIGARADSAKLVWADTGFAIYRPATTMGTSSWVEADWEKITFGPDDAIWSVISPSAGSTGSNPACTVGAKNQLKASNIPKAWGVLTKLAGGNPIVMADGFNVGNAPGSLLDYLQVDFVTPMANTNYAVVLGAGVAPSGGVQLQVVDKATDHFHIAWLNTSGSPVDLDATGWAIDFVVFGKQS